MLKNAIEKIAKWTKPELRLGLEMDIAGKHVYSVEIREGCSFSWDLHRVFAKLEDAEKLVAESKR